MRAPNNDLHSLVISLSKDEKKYFKNYIKHWVKDAPNYIKLFDVISRQKEYNESKIKQKFKGETFIKQLSVSKNYLYNLLLTLLSNYHVQKSIEDRILQGLRHVRILYNKQLYSLAKKTLLQIKEKSICHEYHDYNKTIAYWEITLDCLLETPAIKTEEELECFLVKFEETHQLEQDMMVMNRLSALFNFTQRKGGFLRNSNRDFLQIIQHPLMQDIEHHPSLRIRISGLSIKALFYGLNAQYEEALNSFMIILDAYNNNHDKLNTQKEKYLKYWYNAVFTASYIKDQALFDSFLKKYQPTDIFSPYEQYLINLSIHRSLLMYNFRKGNFTKNVAYIPTIEKFVLDHEVPLIEKDYFIGLFAVQYFGIGDYEKALYYIAEIEGYLRNYHENLISFLLIIKLLIHYSNDQLELIEYSLRRLYYFLRKKDQLFEFEKFLLKTLRKAIGIPSKKELIAYFSVVNEQLIELRNNATQKELEPYTYFNYRAWLESQITGKTLETTAQEHVDFFP